MGVDYFYMTSKGLLRRDQLDYPTDEEGNRQLEEDRRKGVIVKCLIVRCSVTKMVFAHVVPTKGIALPLISAGGTGWIVTAGMLGLLAALDNASVLEEGTST